MLRQRQWGPRQCETQQVYSANCYFNCCAEQSHKDAVHSTAVEEQLKEKVVQLSSEPSFNSLLLISPGLSWGSSTSSVPPLDLSCGALLRVQHLLGPSSWSLLRGSLEGPAPPRSSSWSRLGSLEGPAPPRSSSWSRLGSLEGPAPPRSSSWSRLDPQMIVRLFVMRVQPAQSPSSS